MNATLVATPLIEYENVSIQKFTRDTSAKYSNLLYGEVYYLFGQPWEARKFIRSDSEYVLLVTDAKWHRLFAMKMKTDEEGNWVVDTMVAYGGLGTGIGKFRCPRGIDLSFTLSPPGRYILIADSWNHRVVRLRWSPDSLAFVWCTPLTEAEGIPLRYPVDVCHWGYDYIVDRGNNRIIITQNAGSQVVGVYKGEGTRRLDDPRGIAVHFDYYSYKLRLFVIDKKNRIVMLERESGTDFRWAGEMVFPEAELTSITATQNAIYVLDRKNCKILIIAPNLSRSYGVYGTSGLGVGEFKEPLSLSASRQNILVCEKYTSSSGIQYFTEDLSYIPDDSPQALNVVAKTEATVTLEWEDRSSETYFEIWRSTVPNIWKLVGKVCGSNRFTDTTVIAGKEYAYKVRGYSLDYYTGFSNTVNVFIPYMNSPSLLTASPLSHSSIRLTWRDNSRYNTGYEIEYKVEDGDWQFLTTVSDIEGSSGSMMSHTVNNLSPSTRYSFRVRAYDDEGHYSGWSNKDSGITHPYLTSREPDALRFNNSRKVAVAPDGTICFVHTCHGKVWYTQSQDGVNWEKEKR